ncbi:MAG: DUF1631 domain-containing protein [Pseudoxanthomonas sp.]
MSPASKDTLAAAALPPRVHRILDALLSDVTTTLSERVDALLTDMEQQLFRLAERSRSNDQQSEHLANLHGLRQHRADFLPLFIAQLEGDIARIRTRQRRNAEEDASQIEFNALTLVADEAVDKDIVLRDIVRRHEQRSQPALYMLGQRFGVLAARPALEVDEVPLGPHSLCEALRLAVTAVHVDLPTQLLLFRTFEQKVLANYDAWLAGVNGLLGQQGVLPGLVFAPVHARNRPPAPPARPRADAAAAAAVAPRAQPSSSPPPTGMPSWHAPEETPSFASLQRLLSGRREAMNASAPAPSAGVTPLHPSATPGGAPRPEAAVSAAGPASHAGHPGQAPVGAAATPGLRRPVPMATPDVISGLSNLQAAPVSLRHGQRKRSMMDLRDEVLTQIRLQHGPEAALAPAEADTFELLDLFYNQIEREVKTDAPAVELLVRLQVPVARAAIQDREFFTQSQHPARELLNSVAESGARWMGEDEIDPQLLQKLQQAVAHVLAEYNGDSAVFTKANDEVQEHFKVLARRAEVAERRHVEAARGRDRMEVAKQQAADTIAQAFVAEPPQKFVQALLNQAWADVLTLTLLRQGEDSDAWRDAYALTARIAQTLGQADATPDRELGHQIEASLTRVGYHDDEAAAIARRLSCNGEDEVTSRTELTARLKARANLGSDAPLQRKKERTPRSESEEACYALLRTTAFGTWFEFIQNQQGDVQRKRLSWFSPITDNALFVNQRGQKVGEYVMDEIARLMAIHQVRLLSEQRDTLIDRAWRATVGALRSITGAAE